METFGDFESDKQILDKRRQRARFGIRAESGRQNISDVPRRALFGSFFRAEFDCRFDVKVHDKVFDILCVRDGQSFCVDARYIFGKRHTVVFYEFLFGQLNVSEFYGKIQSGVAAVDNALINAVFVV